jgi:hypothetical protein
MIDHISSESFELLETSDRQFTATHSSIGHLCGRRAGDNTSWWIGEGPCVNLCYGPYIVLESGKYAFWWLVSGPVFRSDQVNGAKLCHIDVANNQATDNPRDAPPPPIVQGDITIEDLLRWESRPGPGGITKTSFEGGFGFKSVNIPTTTANVECRMSITSYCDWMLAKELKIERI